MCPGCWLQASLLSPKSRVAGTGARWGVLGPTATPLFLLPHETTAAASGLS